MNRGVLSLSVLASLLVLAGCTVSGGGGDGGGPGNDPFPGESVETVTVQPTFDSPPVRSDVNLNAGDSRIYRVNISDTVAQNNDVVYFDALPEDEAKVAGHLRVTAYSVSGSQATPLYVSTSNEWFGRPGDPGLASMAAVEDISTATISTTPGVCGGPCVVVPTPSEAGTAYVRVEALQGSVTYDFYVVATEFSDLNEPNDSFSARTTVRPENGAFGDSGSIEAVGDVDWYVPDRPVRGVTFTADNDLRLRAQIYNSSGDKVRLLFPGQTYSGTVNDVLRVEVYSDEDQERAASGQAGRYFIDFNL